MADHFVKSASDETIESLVFAYNNGKDRVQLIEVDGHEVVLAAPSTVAGLSLEQFASEPYRIRAHQKFTDVASFAAYTKRFKDDSTVQIGSLSSGSVIASLDYHASEGPSWVTHRAELVSKVTPEWDAFKKVQQKWQTQIEFADFLELWNHVIIEPQAAHISEIVLKLEGSVDATFQAKINRTNGASTFSYDEDVKMSLTVPTKFKIAVQPFYHSPLTDILIHLRCKMEGSKPKFQLVVANAERVEYEALLEAFKQVETATGDPVLVGP